MKAGHQDNMQRVLYSPTDLINIIKEQWKTAGALVTVEGVYVQCGTKDYRGVWYDAIKSQYASHKLTAIVPTSLRLQMNDGDVVKLCGTIEKVLNDNGQIALQLRVSNIIGRKEKEMDDAEITNKELREQMKRAAIRAAAKRKGLVKAVVWLSILLAAAVACCIYLMNK